MYPFMRGLSQVFSGIPAGFFAGTVAGFSAGITAGDLAGMEGDWREIFYHDKRRSI